MRLPIAPHIQQDMFSSAFGFDDQPRLARRAFDIAERAGARVVRVFSYWRTVDPAACFERVASALCELAEAAEKRGLVIGIENEHACNIATGAETARLLAAVEHPRASGDLGSGECARRRRNALSGRLRAASGLAHRSRAREGLHRPRSRARRSARSAKWASTGAGRSRRWRATGTGGTISLETHWKGPDGDKFQGSLICGRNLREHGSACNRNSKKNVGVEVCITSQFPSAISRARRSSTEKCSASKRSRARTFRSTVRGTASADREVHLIASRDPTFRTGKGVTLEDGHFALRVKSFRAALAHLESKGLPLGERRAGPIDAREHGKRHRAIRRFTCWIRIEM